MWSILYYTAETVSDSNKPGQIIEETITLISIYY